MTPTHKLIAMKTKLTTSHLIDPVEIEWDIEDGCLITKTDDYHRISYSVQEVIELRDFLNQLILL